MTKLSNPVDAFKTTMPQIIPPIVKWLGYGGLLPFVILAAATWFDINHSSLWRDALVGYGAVDDPEICSYAVGRRVFDSPLARQAFGSSGEFTCLVFAIATAVDVGSLYFSTFWLHRIELFL
jgi:hypothetical protein